MDPPPPNVQRLPAADVVAPSSSDTVVQQAYPVRQPEEEHEEFMVRVRASVLTRARGKLTQLAAMSFPSADVLLGISTATGGAATGALASDVTMVSWLGKFFFVVLPMISVGCIVGYFGQRNRSLLDVTRIANEALEDLPDPERTR